MTAMAAGVRPHPCDRPIGRRYIVELDFFDVCDLAVIALIIHRLFPRPSPVIPNKVGGRQASSDILVSAKIQSRVVEPIRLIG